MKDFIGSGLKNIKAKLKRENILASWYQSNRNSLICLKFYYYTMQNIDFYIV